MLRHRVQATDCIHSLAEQYGHSWRTIWDHPENKALRESRESPACLQAGDVVFIPDLSLKTVDLATHREHRFRRKEVPLRLKLALQDDQGEPRANLDFEVEVERVRHAGKTDEDGKLDVPLPPGASRATLRLFVPDEETGKLHMIEEHRLVVGGLDPASSAKGAQARLSNMGLYHGPVDGDFGPRSQDALRRFQQTKGLPVTGELDAATQAALFGAHELR